MSHRINKKYRKRFAKEFLSPRNVCECGKPCYDKKGAVTAKNKRWKEDHVLLRVYSCNGQCWHLTSKIKHENHRKKIFKKQVHKVSPKEETDE